MAKTCLFLVLPITISTPNNQNQPLQNVYFVPKLAANLIFVGQLAENNCAVHFLSSGCVLQDQNTGMVIGKGRKQGRLFILDTSWPISFIASST